MCRQGKQSKGGTQWVCGDHTQAEDDEGEDLLRVGGTASQPYEVQIGKKVRMEVDTGASVSLISQSTQKSLFPTAILQHSNIKLQSYTRHSIPVIGMMKVQVKYGGYEGSQVLHVVDGCGPALLGRDWIRLNWQEVRAVRGNVSHIKIWYANTRRCSLMSGAQCVTIKLTLTWRTATVPPSSLRTEILLDGSYTKWRKPAF